MTASRMMFTADSSFLPSPYLFLVPTSRFIQYRDSQTDGGEGIR